MSRTPEDASPWVPRPEFRLALPSGRSLDLTARPLLMGILNVTPDSFSDGGRFYDRSAAVRHGRDMCAEGADIVDIGGESTRPGSEPVEAEEEIRRVVPVIEQLVHEVSVPVSIDTQKRAVAEAALQAGAQIINDVSALRTDPEVATLAAEHGAPIILMHMLGSPRTMQRNPTYQEVVTDICDWLARRVEFAVDRGVPPEALVLDPGFGFGKTLQHNLELLRRLHEFHSLGHPLLVGTSRKSMLGMILDRPEPERLHGTLATVATATLAGCHLVRVHDVEPALEVVKVCEAIRRGADFEK